MGGQRQTSPTSADLTDRLDEQRFLDESVIDAELVQPLDAPIETPIVDALDQRRVEPLDDDQHDVS
jgi:hypothetical protein